MQTIASLTDFLEIVKNLGISTDPYQPFSIDSLFLYDDYKRAKKGAKKIPYILQYWETGGVSGGSCWENSDPQPYTSHEKAPITFEDLDKILMAICPQITFLQYKRLESEVVKMDGSTEYEYYGNHTDYAYKVVLMKDLYEKLVEFELIKTE